MKKTLPIKILVVLALMIGLTHLAKHKAETTVTIPKGGTTSTIPRGIAAVENTLLSRLQIDKASLLDGKSTLTTPDDELRKSMSMRVFHSVLEDYSEGKHLRFEAHHEYNIGGNGKQSITFDLVSISDTQTTVTVDYYEYGWALGSTPLFLNSGEKEESHIILTIFGDDIN